jgi:hypothetical protein
MVLASFQSLRIAFEGCHWKDYPVVADATIVDNAAKGGLVPALLCLDTIRIDCVYNNVPGPVISVTACLLVM